MDPINEGIAGFIKPLLDLIASVLLYAFAQIFIALNSIKISTASTNYSALGVTFDPLLFLGIFTVVAILEEILWGMREGYFEPINAIFKTGGILIGTYIFWGVLVQTQKSFGGSEIDVIFAEGIAVVAMLLGLCIRYKFSESF